MITVVITDPTRADYVIRTVLFRLYTSIHVRYIWSFFS